jgi:small subunit ribosomal protein S6e
MPRRALAKVEKMKVVISDPKTGQSYQSELDKARETEFLGKKIGETVDGGALGLPGCTLEIRGGSDTSGFPMRKDISGSRKIAAILTKGVGFRAKGRTKGTRMKKTLRGNTIAADEAQVNLKLVANANNVKLEEVFPKKEKAAEKK